MKKLVRLFAPPERRVIELDFLRGLAILLVAEYHSQFSLVNPVCDRLHILGFGWAGVNIFFVLSGFLVGGLLIEDWRRFGGDSRRFLVRRAMKLWPQYYVFLLFSMTVGHLTLRAAVPNLLQVQSYFPSIEHTWSLAVEEHAYLLLTFVFMLASRGKLTARSLFVMFAALALLETPLRYWLTLHGHKVFFTTHTRADGILYGVLLALLYHFAPVRFERLRALRPLWLAVLCAGAAMVCYPLNAERQSWGEAFQIDGANFVAIGLFLLLFTHSQPGTEPRPTKASPENGTDTGIPITAATFEGARRHGVLYRAVSWVGLYSYGIYLWHREPDRPVLWLHAHLPGAPRWSLDLFAVGSAVAIGTVTTVLIELPMLRVRERVFPKRVASALELPPHPQGDGLELRAVS